MPRVGALVCAPWIGLSATGSRDAEGRRAIPIDYRKAPEGPRLNDRMAGSTGRVGELGELTKNFLAKALGHIPEASWGKALIGMRVFHAYSESLCALLL